MYRVYGMTDSGNCYKIKLLLSQLKLSFEWIEIDILKGETHTPAFLAMNPAGQVPVLEIKPGHYLAQSNAILYYLSEGTAFLPEDGLQRALILQWLFFEQYSHEPYIATSRFWLHILKKPDDYREQLKRNRERGHGALDVMEKHLQENNYFVTNHYTVADIGLYAYTHVAYEGGFELVNYPAIQGWLKRVAAQPLHVTMTK